MASVLDRNPALKQKIRILPDTPGVYLYYDAEGTVIYVGKAKISSGVYRHISTAHTM